MQNKLEMIRIFCVAAESRNFKEAATQLGISPQLVTRAIKELEAQRSPRQASCAGRARAAWPVRDAQEARDVMGGAVRLTVSAV